jgi:glyoxylase-like metal-dependent hydrolase (beta-lactamase superfamily II)
MAKSRVLEHFFREDAATSARLEEEGKGRRTFSWLAGATLEAGMVVGDGDVLDLGHGSTMKFFAAPGHSPCSLAVYLPERDTMLVSDSLGFFLGAEDNFPLFFHDYRFYLDTVRRLGRVCAATVGAAHESVFVGDEAARCFTVAQDAAEELCRFVETSRDRQRMVEELFNRYYRDGLSVYSPQNIKSCVELLVRRATDARRAGPGLRRPRIRP